ncbi:MAG: hypothetical protein ACTSUX_06010 [Promethearchaeota archaeon]
MRKIEEERKLREKAMEERGQALKERNLAYLFLKIHDKFNIKNKKRILNTAKIKIK